MTLGVILGFVLTLLVSLHAAAQEPSRNVIRWRNEAGEVKQLDVGPSLPRNATEPAENTEPAPPEETLREKERRLQAERDNLRLQKEISELEREIESIDRQIDDLHSRQDRQRSYDDDYDGYAGGYYLGWEARRRAAKQRRYSRYRDRLRHYGDSGFNRRPPREPRHRVQRKVR